MDLTDRQKQLLKAIIELYVKTGEPVSSELVEKTCDLGVSPATIRNEMVKLTDLAVIKQPHTSAGRVPTASGFRIYIKDLMQEKDVPVIDEVTIKQRMMEKRARFEEMVREATRALANKCDTLALSITDDNLYYAGAANILDLPEFYDIDVTRFVLSLFDEAVLLKQLIDKAQGSDPLHIIFGEETGFPYLRTTSFAFVNFDDGTVKEGVIGMIGPDRLNFPVVIPYLRYVGSILNDAVRVV